MISILKTFVKLSPLLLLFLFTPTPAHATIYDSFIFDNLNTADLNGQDSWTGSASFDVVSCPSYLQYGSGKCVSVGNSLNQQIDGVFPFNLASTTDTYRITVLGAVSSTSKGWIFTVGNISNINDQPCRISMDQPTARFEYVNTVGTQYTTTYVATKETQFQAQIIVNPTSQQCTISVDGRESYTFDFGAQYNANYGVDRVILNGTSGNETRYWDDIYVTDNNTSTSTSDAVTCSTCTRIISFDPDTGEILASSTNGYTASVAYYVSSDDFCDLLCTTFIELAILPPLSSTRIVYTEEVANSNVQLNALHYFSEINATGTYAYEIKIYNRYLFGALRTNLLWDIHKFYVGQENTLAELSAYATSSRGQNWDTISNLEEGSDDLGTASDPGVIPFIIEHTAKEFLLLPPWGYVVYFNIAVQTGTSSGLSSLPISFPTSSPAHNLSLNLPLSTAFDDAIATVRAEGVSNELGDSYDQIEYYWELFWYIVFTLWLIREVSGFSFFTPSGSTTPMSNTQRESMTLRVGNRKGDIDMRQ